MTYPLSGPSPTPGLYLVKNMKTLQVYAGQTVNMHRRYAEWRHIISTKLRSPNHAVEDAIKLSDRSDWVFEVLMECPVANLKRGEEKLIAKLVASKGPLCLNVPDAGVRKPRVSKTGSLPLSEVLDENGVAMPYAVVAKRLGIDTKSVAKRLRRLRQLGRFRISIDDFPARQQHLPRKF